ncbi:helix-turn-helix domain-containing protein [Anaerosolibacter sp.]|uniref:helix-turn-helix domain-containing protein n=1 Tax=Anaerosolibacter sp. TaxID=1872527 RepID=UPI0039F019E8
MLGDNIRRERKKKKISINNLSKLSGVSLGYLSDLENNKVSNPTIDKLLKIAYILDVSVDEFFKEDTDSATNEKTYNLVEKSLPVIPEEFTDPAEARAYVEKHQIFGSDGFDPDSLDDKEILEFANALLEQMKMVSYKYRK